jgi:SSS family solute:Na+ symporter
MGYNSIDVFVIVLYFVILIGVGFWKGRGQRGDSGQYFLSKGTLPWWVIGAAYVAAGMNSEQLVGQNGMGYTIGLTMVNWYAIAVVVYPALIFFFFPVYMRNNIVTMPEYLGRRFGKTSENVFTVILLVSYIFLNLAVVFYGGGKLLEVIFGIDLWVGLVLLAVVAGIYTMYGGMASMVYTAFFQFLLIFVSGFVLFTLGYLKLPNGWQDVIDHAPGGFHLIQPMNYDVIPWHAIPLTLFGLHLFYSCINQALVQRGLGARTEWDARMAIIFAGFFVLLRPFLEILPGMIARALAATGHTEFELGDNPVDNVFPMLIRNLVPVGFQGLVLIGILSSVMSTIAAFLNSISTLFTFDVYRKWIRKNASEKELVRVGVISTLILMVFSVVYSPVIGSLGGIFQYFQAAASYLAVPVATVFLFGMFWKRATPAAANTIIIGGIPIGLVIHLVLIPAIFSEAVIERYSLDNFFVACGITQIVCSLIMYGVSLKTPSRPIEQIQSLLWKKEMFFLPKNEPRKPLLKSVGFWWLIFTLLYIAVYIKWW